MDLAALSAAGRSAWPEVVLSPEELARSLAARKEPIPEAALAGPHAADIYLACACERGEPKALALFEARFLARVPMFVARLSLPGVLVEEVRQGLALRLLVASEGALPRIAEYAGRGTLESWVRIAAIRFGLNVLRLRKSYQPLDSEGGEARALEAGSDPEMQILKQRHQADFTASLREAFAALSPRARNLLRLRYLDGAGMAELGTVYGVHRMTIARWLQTAELEVLEGTRVRLRERLRLNAAECDSLIRMAQSQLEITLSGLLR